MNSTLQIFALVCVLATVTALVAGESSPPTIGWRADGTGRFANAQPPTTWSKNSHNIVWKVELPRGYSSPVLWKGNSEGHSRLLLTAEPAELFCIDAATGDIVWRQSADYKSVLGEQAAAEIAETHGKLEAERRAAKQEYENLRKEDPTSPNLEALKQKQEEAELRRREYDRQYPPERRGGAGNAAATVACDGTRAVAVFGTGIVAAFDLNGNRLWARHLEPPLQGFGHSSSPVFAGGRVIVHFQQLTALNPETGETVWRADVPAKFGTPAVVRSGKDDVLITPSGALVVAADGRVVAEKQFQLSENSPVVHGDFLFVHEQGSVKAFQLIKSLSPPLALEPLWKVGATRGQRMASALYHDGLLYAGGRNGIMDVTDAATGELVYRKRLDIGELFASPTLAGDFIFFGGKQGRTLVLRPGREYDELAINETERYSTTPLFDGSRMYLRTDNFLYCIGEKE